VAVWEADSAVPPVAVHHSPRLLVSQTSLVPHVAMAVASVLPVQPLVAGRPEANGAAVHLVVTPVRAASQKAFALGSGGRAQ